MCDINKVLMKQAVFLQLRFCLRTYCSYIVPVAFRYDYPKNMGLFDPFSYCVYENVKSRWECLLSAESTLIVKSVVYQPSHIYPCLGSSAMLHWANSAVRS